MKEQWLYSEREDSLFRKETHKKANLATGAGNMIGLFILETECILKPSVWLEPLWANARERFLQN